MPVHIAMALVQVDITGMGSICRHAIVFRDKHLWCYGGFDGQQTLGDTLCIDIQQLGQLTASSHSTTPQTFTPMKPPQGKGPDAESEQHAEASSSGRKAAQQRERTKVLSEKQPKSEDSAKSCTSHPSHAAAGKLSQMSISKPGPKTGEVLLQGSQSQEPCIVTRAQGNAQSLFSKAAGMFWRDSAAKEAPSFSAGGTEDNRPARNKISKGEPCSEEQPDKDQPTPLSSLPQGHDTSVSPANSPEESTGEDDPLPVAGKQVQLSEPPLEFSPEADLLQKADRQGRNTRLPALTSEVLPRSNAEGMQISNTNQQILAQREEQGSSEPAVCCSHEALPESTSEDFQLQSSPATGAQSKTTGSSKIPEAQGLEAGSEKSKDRPETQTKAGNRGENGRVDCGLEATAMDSTVLQELIAEMKSGEISRKQSIDLDSKHIACSIAQGASLNPEVPSQGTDLTLPVQGKPALGTGSCEKVSSGSEVQKPKQSFRRLAAAVVNGKELFLAPK